MQSEQRKVLDHIFYSLGRFSFDRAKEICDREKDAIKNPQGFAAVWSQFVVSLSQLSLAEKGYMMLVFLTQTPNNKKAFRNKELPMRSLYGQIKHDLEKTVDALRGLPPLEGYSDDLAPPVLSHLCTQLSHFTAARLDMCDVYERLHEMGLDRTNRYPEVNGLVDMVIGAYGKKFHHPCLAILESAFSYETEILKSLIDAQLSMANWDFLASLVHINQAHRRLALWPTSVQAPESSLPANYKIAPLKSISPPALYTWFVKYQTALLAKFSLYFHDVLSKQTGLAAEFRTLLTRNNPDYYSKIATFQRKSDASHICLVLDTNGMDYRGPGYRFPGAEIEKPTGLDTYPVIFSYPAERPTKHWPSIVMILASRSDQFEGPDNAISTYDKIEKENKITMERTYFIARIEERFYIVLIFEIKKSEKDSAVNLFLSDMVTQLRGSAVLESLKPV
ncbi:KICSTOR subunit 2-like [Paramacrobiotus metropolitanus]|uniref:KICSTOR subunit 2-like n=1 Tax=Paramacrobiotus metropolitanus TaxID=2943436 RepID=UPI0024463EA7|nr:KICSTOR subunit 2-like [Paramacrobiotus metropolitanus]